MKKNKLFQLTSLRLIYTFLGLGYSILQVQIFGATREIETFFVAQSLVYLITSLTQTGQLSEVFLPVYLGIKKEHNAVEAERAFSVVLNRLLIAIVSLLIVLFFASPLLINLMVPGYNFDDKKIVILLFRSFLLFVPILVVCGFLNTVLNAERIYGRIESVAIISTILSSLILILTNKYLGIWSIVISLYAGKLIELFTGIYIYVRKGMRYYLIFHSPNLDIKGFLRNIYSTFVYTLSTQLYNVVLTSGASFLQPGIYAIYTYCLNIYSKVSGIIIGPMSTMFFTNIAEMHVKNDSNKIFETIKKNISVAFFIGVLVFLCTVAAGKEGLLFLWASRKFELDDINWAYLFLLAFFFLFIFQGAVTVYRKFLVVLGHARLFYNVSSIGMLLSAVITYILIKYLNVYGLLISVIVARLLFMFSPILVFRSREKLILPVLERKFLLIVGIIAFIISLVFLKKHLNIDFTKNRITAFLCMVMWTSITLIFVSPLLILSVQGAKSGFYQFKRKLSLVKPKE